MARLRVLVVGGGGFIGQHVVRQSVEAGFETTAMDLYRPEPTPQGVNWVTGSVADEALLASAIALQNVVIYLANSSLPAASNADMAAEVAGHVRTAVKAAEIARQQCVTRFLFASSGGTVYGVDSETPLDEEAPTRPRNAYGASKLSIEHYLRILAQLYPIHTLSLRISNPYGEGQRAARGQGFVAAAMEAAFDGRTLPIWGDGTVVRDFIHVADVADAFIRGCAYDGPASVINIGAGAGASLREMVAAVEAASGLRLATDFQADRPIDVRRNVLDTRLAATELGWRPQTSLEDGLRRTAAWWRTRQNAAMSG